MSIWAGSEKPAHHFKIMEELIKKVQDFPDSPGVYIMRDSSGDIVYIGKATSLKERVRSYFGKNLSAKTVLQMAHVKSIEFQVTESPIEALFLESRLIKQYMPKYNIKERDDKSRIYIHITKDEFPKIETVRETDLYKLEKNPLLYGPFLSARAVADALELIRKIIPFRSCGSMPRKACLYGYIGLCPQPCLDKVSKEEYRRQIRRVRDFFEGKKSRVFASLKIELTKASRRQEYEKAAKVRDRIYALEHLKEMFILSGETKPTQFSRIEGYDISNISGAFAVGSMVVFTDGVADKSEYRKFKIKWVKGANDTAMMQEVLIRRFNNDWPKPDLILVDGGRGQVNAAAFVLNKMNLEIPVIGLAKGPDRKKDELVTSRTMPRKEMTLFKQVRDEAHRFAKGYYERLHRKSITN